ncbi:MAG: flavin-binding family monooxygenase [Solirubrobacterales bacterium]|nr:flavin-binding family monooxygenase [Solirubrobacterales bacterium]
MRWYRAAMSATTTAPPEHLDVLIVGAGLSGIGAACRLRMDLPSKSFALLESRDASGGTWDLFRYPGIRSDSDMFTLGYRFRPWTQPKAIADGPSILDYIRETAREHGVDQRIRYGLKVVRAQWSTPDARWTVEARRTETGESVRLTCSFLLTCTGYYRYDEGYTPHFEGRERFAGEIVHPQHWPEDLDYAGKRVVVIGSGATAVTLLPAMTDAAEHVTMLQRSPSYVMALPSSDPVADALRRRLPARLAYGIVRWKNVLATTAFYTLSQRAPRMIRRLIRKGATRMLPEGYDVDTHFNPRYDPWDQRVCFVPDGDLFRAIRHGHASIVTDTIETFTETGIKLSSGDELPADVIVTATGLNVLALGGISLAVDGEEVAIHETVGYKGMMISGVPNYALMLGYTNASWTLKCDLVSEYVCRLLAHLDATGNDIAMPLAPDPSEPTEPFLDLAAGYILRSLDQLPRQGARTPWRLNQNYPRDVLLLRRGRVQDEGIRFSRSSDDVRAAAAGPPASAAEPQSAVAAPA